MTKTIEKFTCGECPCFESKDQQDAGFCACTGEIVFAGSAECMLRAQNRKLEKENKILAVNCSKSVMRRLKIQTDIDFSEREDHADKKSS